MPRRRHRHLGHQRRGHARPVGVPGRPAEPARRVRPAVGGPLAALPRRRGLRRRRRRSTRSRSRATGTAPARTPTSRPRRCASATTRSSPRARRSARRPQEHVAELRRRHRAPPHRQHETAPWYEFSYGVSDRGASVRIPWQVEVDKKGYIEDRRPNANMDPYVVTRLITDTVCSALGRLASVALDTGPGSRPGISLARRTGPVDPSASERKAVSRGDSQ